MMDVVGTLRRAWANAVAHLDFPLLLITAAIMAIGLGTVYSATYDSTHRMMSQAGNMGIALVVMWVVSRIPPQKLMSFAIPLYVIGIVLLIAVFLFGIKVNGARRWLSIGFTRVQPSEIMKIAMPLMLAWYFHKYEATLKLKHYGVAALLLLVPFALVAKQPDLGTALLDRRRRLLCHFLCRPAVEDHHWPAGQCRRSRPHPVEHAARLPAEAHPDPDRPDDRPARLRLPHHPGDHRHRLRRHRRQGLPERDANPPRIHPGKAYRLHLRGLFRGMGPARQRHADLPVHPAHRPRPDDRLGCADHLPRLLAGAITLGFFTYAFINMGMVSGILPVVGVPLPFMSFGGTALVILFLGIGMLMSIHTHRMLVKK